jgi:hypothetical protein
MRMGYINHYKRKEQKCIRFWRTDISCVLSFGAQFRGL